MSRKALIIGAGPAGLTAAYELLERTDIKPIIFEKSNTIGGIARTINYKGNRMDMGGHRFFSKSDRVMNWWRGIMPLQGAPAHDDILLHRSVPLSEAADAPDPEKEDMVLLTRTRISRILYARKFFDYPISLSVKTLTNLGLWQLVKIGISYVKSLVLPIKPERSLEDFMINRFGRELYLTFFKDYTEKVWGVAPTRIKPDWGAQRIKGVSILKVLQHALLGGSKQDQSVAQKSTETSLIGRFMYPKFGPGQLWEEVARRIRARGGEIHLNQEVVGLTCDGNRIHEITVRNTHTNQTETCGGDYVLSTMPVRDLIGALQCAVPADVQRIARGLVYREFVTVGILVKKLNIQNKTRIKTINNIIPDLWMYVQESDVKVGRLQIFNNWSPYLVAAQDTVWLGLEYFCSEGDALWSLDDTSFIELGISELEKIGIIARADVIDATVARMPKTYPAYFGTYDHFGAIRQYTDTFENLFLIGRTGMHRYNNMDHSMLSAMAAVDTIVQGSTNKETIWAINAEEEYHEER